MIIKNKTYSVVTTPALSPTRLSLPGVCMLLLLLLCSFSGGNVRITPNAVAIANDSLHFDWIIDLREVSVPSGYAHAFIPMLRTGRHTLDLPAVVIAGKRRNKADNRAQALRLHPLATPYVEIPYHKHRSARLVHYKISIPYARWMGDSELVLRQVSRDCCNERLLAADVLITDVVPASMLIMNELNTVAPEVKDRPMPIKAAPTPPGTGTPPDIPITPVPQTDIVPDNALDTPRSFLVSTFVSETGVAAILNASSAALVAGDTRLARAYLEQVKNDPRANNNWGVLYVLEGDDEAAARCFRAAEKTDPVWAGENRKRLEKAW